MPQITPIVYNVFGMHCSSCALNIEKYLSAKEGIIKCSVNFVTEKIFIEFNPEIISSSAIIQEIELLGFKASTYSMMSEKISKSIYKDLTHVVIAWLLSSLFILPIFINQSHSFKNPIYGFLICGIVIFYLGLDIIKRAWQSLSHGFMNMDVLISLGALSAWISSLLRITYPNIPDYSMIASMLISINLTGNFLELMIKRAATESLTSLVNFSSELSLKESENGSLVEIPINTLEIGDIVHVKPGNKIPGDGIIISGQTSINESLLTGESLPINKKEGDYVFASSINTDGYIIIELQKHISQSLLSQTIRLIEETQKNKIPIQILVDKVTHIFIPIVISLSFITFAIWFAFPNVIPNLLEYLQIGYLEKNRFANALSMAISVLVISCPCALGLATPIAVFCGSLLATKKGILITNGAAVQMMTKINVVALDKTGTLTVGTPELNKIFYHPDIEEEKTQEKYLSILASLEIQANHPLANAVIDYANKKKISYSACTDIKNYPGQGVEGTFEKCNWFAGSLKSSIEKDILLCDYLSAFVDEEMAKGRSIICFSNLDKKECLSIISFSDMIHADTASMIKMLKQMHKKIIMLTGDNKNAANHVAKTLEISSVFSECSPKDKVDAVLSMKEQNYSVCFVGDGINDAAALEAADVGIAMSTGTDIAGESSDIILMTGSPLLLISTFKIAQIIFKTVKVNLIWAFLYNIIAIPMAFLGMVNPISAEIAMSFSSITVIGNSLLLLRTKI